MLQQEPFVSRRKFITGSTSATAAVAAGSLVTNADLENITADVNTNSSPTDLKITDMRIAHSDRSMLMRLDTNQGICGYGEIRYDCSKAHGLILKSRIIGMNPCNVAEIFRKIKKHGGFGCDGGGVSGHRGCLLGPGGQGLGRARLADAGRQDARPRPPVLRHHQPADRRNHGATSEGTDRGRLDLLQDGPACRRGRRGHPRAGKHRGNVYATGSRPDRQPAGAAILRRSPGQSEGTPDGR